MAPPATHSTTASTRNWRRMSRARAPTAIRSPISRVRSVTETSMMFMIPTPPTTSEIMATHSSRLVINRVVEVRVLVISVMSRMVKSSGSPGRMRWRSRRISVICSIAAGISSGLQAAVRIWSMLVKRTGMRLLADLAVRGLGVEGGRVGGVETG